MEALWSLDDKWKLSTQQAVLLFVCTAFSVIGVCTAVTLKKKKKGTWRRQVQVVVGGEDVDEAQSMIGKKWGDGGCGWGSIKRLLMNTVRWSGASRWEEKPMPLLAVRRYEGRVGWQSHNSVSPVWQRPILMGEKCELPRFSGLILYDVTGQPLHQPHRRLGSEGNILCLGTSAFESANLGDQEKLLLNDPDRTNEKLHILKSTLVDPTTTLPSHGWFPHHSSSDKQQVRNDIKNSKGVLIYFIIKSEKTASKK